MSKKFPIKPFSVSEPVFGSAVTVYMNCQYQDMLDDIRSSVPGIVLPKGFDDAAEHKDSDGCLFNCDSKEGGVFRVLWVRKVLQSDIQSLSVLVHEIVHLCQYICERKGISTHAKEAEPLAYLCEFYFRNIVNKVPPK